jgi:hypothetical protein
MYNILTYYRYILIINNRTPHGNLIEKLPPLSLIENLLYCTGLHYMTPSGHSNSQACHRQSADKPQALLLHLLLSAYLDYLNIRINNILFIYILFKYNSCYNSLFYKLLNISLINKKGL